MTNPDDRMRAIRACPTESEQFLLGWLDKAERAYATAHDQAMINGRSAQQLRGNLSLAEEGLANYAQEVGRLQKREDQLMEFLRSFISGGVNQDFKPWGRELYQKLYSAHEPSDDRILPCDVTVGNTTIKAGLPVSTVLKSIKVHAEARVAFSGPSTKALDGGQLCEDCPPVGYPTDKTRCDECPRHT